MSPRVFSVDEHEYMVEMRHHARSRTDVVDLYSRIFDGRWCWAGQARWNGRHLVNADTRVANVADIVESIIQDAMKERAA